MNSLDCWVLNDGLTFDIYMSQPFFECCEHVIIDLSESIIN